MAVIPNKREIVAVEGTSAHAALFVFEVAYRGDRSSVTVTGELDGTSSPILLRELFGILALPISRLTVDLGNVTAVDSAGLAALVAVRNGADDRGIGFELASIPRNVRRVLGDLAF